MQSVSQRTVARRLGVRMVSLVGVLALIAAACGTSDDTTTTTAAPTGGADTTTTTQEPMAEELPTVKIAHTTHLTGPAADHSEKTTNAVKLAFKQINEQGGILGGRQLELLNYDEGYSADVAVASAKKALQDGALIMLGGGDATACVPIMHVFREAQRPSIITGCGSEKPALESDGWAVHIRTPVNSIETDSNALSVLARWMIAKGYTSVSAVGVDSEWVINTDAEYKRVFDAEAPADFTYNGMIYFPYGTAEARIEITKAVAQNPDMLYMGLWGRDVMQTAINTALELGYTGDIMINEYVFTQEEADALGEPAEGVYTSTEFLPDPDIPENKAFVDAYVAEYGKEPEALGALQYDAAWMAALAIDAAGCADTSLECSEKIRDAIKVVNYVDINGNATAFTPWGRRIVPGFYIGQVIDGTLVTIDEAAFTYGDQTEPGLG